jgi:hypothetical protein
MVVVDALWMKTEEREGGGEIEIGKDIHRETERE